MTQMGRNSTMVECAFLIPGQHLLCVSVTKFCHTFQETMKADGVTLFKFRSRSPPEFPCRTLGEAYEEGSPVRGHPLW
ncbi:MAG: hypothetical protein NPIRA03_24580 [Nitrospirales bacterium]|nr:MAG: hypothetical protein NPIRA03_24580 [Nitrospirales bacterium]